MSGRKLVPRADRTTINHEFASLDEFIAEYVTNISTTGAFIRTREPLPVGTLVQLRFSVIVDDVETIEGLGEVVRVQSTGPAKDQGMGVVFVELTAHSADLVARLLTRRRGGAAMPATVAPVTTRKSKAVPPPPPPPRRKTVS